MAVSYATTLKNNRMQDVSDTVASRTIAAATGTALAGKLVIGTSALSGATGVLATLNLPTTPFTIAGGIATLQGTPLTTTATAAGTAAKAEFRTNGDVMVAQNLSVGVGAGFDIDINNVTIALSQTVTVSSGTITHSA